MAGAIVNAATTIGPAVILNTGSSVDHNCVVEDGSHLSPGVTVGGGVTIGRGSWIGIGASVIHGVTVGKNVMVAAGSVVIEDIPDDTRVAGVPARPMGSRP
jgi:acetyltransferase-like isoleucine patch superfamily enzyme